MKEVEKTTKEIKEMTNDEIDLLAKNADNPEFVKKLLKDIKAKPDQPDDAIKFIQWGYSNK